MAAAGGKAGAPAAPRAADKGVGKGRRREGLQPPGMG